MQNTININLRSHNSLRNSNITDSSPNQHLNPLSSRPGLTKKISLNSKLQNSCTTPTTKNQAHYEWNNQYKTSYLTSNPIAKNQSFITLGNKNKQQNSSQNNISTISLNIGELNTKIQQIVVQIEKHNKRLVTVQSKISQNQNSIHYKDEGLNSRSVNQATWGLNTTDYLQIKSEIHNIRSEFTKFSQKREVERKLESCESSFKQAVLSLKIVVNEEMSKADAKIDKVVKKQLDKLRSQFERKMQFFQKRVGQYFEEVKIKNLNGNNYFRPGKYGNILMPLLRNPGLRLKFISKVSLIDINSKNPESQFEQEKIQSYSQTYMIDKDGYLLDENQRYLTNQQGDCIKLNNQQIKILLGTKILQSCQ